VNDQKQREIKKLFKEILGKELEDTDLQELLHAIQPDSLLERFAYRKQAGMHSNNKDFIKLKGSKGQIDHSEQTD